MNSKTPASIRLPQYPLNRSFSPSLSLLPTSLSLSLSLSSPVPFCRFSTTMGKVSGKTKRPEKLGKGLVTPIQVAFIVDRYLIDNNYTQTFSVFRSEASALLSKSKMKEAPKSLLSLEDILNEYISLKEQRVFLDQEKTRVEKLLQGMQEVMKAYQSSDHAAISTRPEPVPSTTTANSVNTNPVPTLRNVASHSSTTSMVPTISSQNNKRKVSGSVPQPYSSAKKSFPQVPAYIPNRTANRPQPQEVGHVTGTGQTFTGYSKTQTISHDQILPSSLLQGQPVSNSELHQSYTPEGESSSPKTPQQHSLQTDAYCSPMETASPNQSTVLSPEVTTANDYVRQSGANENTSSGCGMYEDCQQFCSPSKFGTKRSGKMGHIKGRLDFDDSSTAVNSERSISESPGPLTVGAKEGVFDIDDLLNFGILDNDVSLSYLIDFEFDSQVAALADQSSLDPATKLISSPCVEKERNSRIGGAFSNFPRSNAVVLSERDMNSGIDDSAQLSKPLPACIKANSPGKKRQRFSVDQENVLIL
ncbi:uncharacterized protein LOC116256472 isoform X2 [Nymphaea colorata]|uniref:uncharacterized protein LOC116256472 isoform X2 n=1 Tax=Nymphaea colorata TaxID=210225 RepID=UPI00214EF371|nr:uncharacterized protein LOC116256472 isoform X2 [Nymphaea colorata]